MPRVVGWLRRGSRFAFQRQVRQMHRMHRTQDIIFADVKVLVQFCICLHHPGLLLLHCNYSLALIYKLTNCCIRIFQVLINFYPQEGPDFTPKG